MDYGVMKLLCETAKIITLMVCVSNVACIIVEEFGRMMK